MNPSLRARSARSGGEWRLAPDFPWGTCLGGTSLSIKVAVTALPVRIFGTLVTQFIRRCQTGFIPISLPVACVSVTSRTASI